MRDLLLLWAASLPIGYFVVARYYPEQRLSWRELAAMAMVIMAWPLVVVITFFKSET